MANLVFELERCPHCGSDAQVRAHPIYRFQCNLCGSPRIPVDQRWVTTPAPVARVLAQARGHHVQGRFWQVGSWVLTVIAVVVGLFGSGTAWSLDFSAAGWAFISVLATVPLVLAWLARLTATKQRTLTTTQIEGAWREMAGHFFTNGSSPRTLQDVKAAFSVDAETALALLAEGEVAAYLEPRANDAQHEARFRVVDQPGGPAIDPHEVNPVADLAAAPRRGKLE